MTGQREDAAALIANRVAESISVKQAILEDGHLLNQAAAAALLFRDAVSDGHKIVLFGNGGSAADAAHMAAELVGRFRLERRGMPALALTDNAAALTAISNDYGYENVFVRQLEAIGAPGDVAVGLSTSGRSSNVVMALSSARSLGMRTVAFTGEQGSACAEHAELCLRIPSSDTARVQEATVAVLHAICEWVEAECGR